LTYGRIGGLVALIGTIPALLLVIVRRTRAHRRSPLGQAEIALLRLTLDPDETLSELHQLLSNETRALTLLEHMPGLAREAGEPGLGDLLQGAYLALARDDVLVEALHTITGALQGLSDLPLAEETQHIYTLLVEALTATSLPEMVRMRRALGEQGTALEEHETYLTPATEELGRLGGTARTLRACEQAETSRDRITYLAEAAADLGVLERHANEGLDGLERRATVAVARHWLGLVTDTLEQLRGRAEIDMMLRTRRLVLGETVILGLTLTNKGRSPATDLAIELMSGEGLSPASEPTTVNVLPPGANTRLELAARPTGLAGSFEIALRIVWDDRERAGKEVKFTERIRLIPAPREFVPIPNPYATGRPLEPGSPVFVGRTNLFAFVQEKLAGGHIVALVGERRMGKTSLLRQLPARLSDAWVVAFLDGQGLGLEGGLAHWLADAALEISRAAGYEPHPSPDDLGSQPGPAFETYLTQVVGGLPEGRRLLVLLDESEEMEVRVRNGDLPPAIFPYLRHLMQFGEVSFLLASTQRLERLSPEYWTPLFNLGVYREIGPLEEVAARKLITAPVEGKLLYDDLAIDKLLRFSGRQPYFLQLLCHCLIAHCNQERYVTVIDVDLAANDALSLGQGHLRFLWNSALAEGQALLIALAQLAADGEPGTLPAISAKLSSLGRAFQRKQVLETLEHLKTLGLINKSAGMHYRFSADLLQMLAERES
jgi:hypothetical protein